jgi:AcrR family transcriptional regulator
MQPYVQDSSMSQSATQPVQARKGELSGDRLLEISATLFRERGYASTTMRDIANAAGMKAGSLYYHFQSKDQILDLVLERGISEAIRGFNAAIAQFPADSPFEQRLQAVVTAHLRTVVEFGTYTVASRQLLSQVPEELRERHLAMRREYDILWRRLLDEAAGRGEIRPTADYGIVRLFLLGALNWSSEWLDPRKKSIEELGKIATDLFLHGLDRS